MHYICNVFGTWGHIRMRIMPNEGNMLFTAAGHPTGFFTRNDFLISKDYAGF